MITAFKKSLVKINIVKINIVKINIVKINIVKINIVKINIEGLQKARAVVSKKSGFLGLVGSFKGGGLFQNTPYSLKSFIVKQSLKTIYSTKNYGSLSFACFYHFFKSKSVR
ncbi:hypothetical protein JT213_06570 [Helicobacter pylori]|nr:hypothetical protein [Helicobacter pylori]